MAAQSADNQPVKKRSRRDTREPAAPWRARRRSWFRGDEERQRIPWKMIGFLVLLVLFTAFTALNLGNRSDVNLWVHTFQNVPVFLTGLVAFILGAVLVLPLALRGSSRRPARAAASAQLPAAAGAERAPAAAGAERAPAAVEGSAQATPGVIESDILLTPPPTDQPDDQSQPSGRAWPRRRNRAPK